MSSYVVVAVSSVLHGELLSVIQQSVVHHILVLDQFITSSINEMLWRTFCLLKYISKPCGVWWEHNGWHEKVNLCDQRNRNYLVNHLSFLTELHRWIRVKVDDIKTSYVVKVIQYIKWTSCCKIWNRQFVDVYL